MPGKKTSKTRKPAAKAAARKAPAARKAAKPAARKPRVSGARAKAAKPAKTAKAKTRAPARAAATPQAAKPPKPAKSVSAAREPAAVKPRFPTAIAQAAEARPGAGSHLSRLGRRPAPGDDDDDAGSAHNLLLGPRNVRPYRERKGEQYMGRDQLEHFRGILSSWKRDLMEEVDRTMTHMKDEAANPPDPNDRATLESEFALELRTRDRERKLIRKIEEALSRIEDGSYGYCIETGEPIGVKRLEARPVATLCIEAQERRERREKQYGDRDDWYR